MVKYECLVCLEEHDTDEVDTFVCSDWHISSCAEQGRKWDLCLVCRKPLFEVGEDEIFKQFEEHLDDTALLRILMHSVPITCFMGILFVSYQRQDFTSFVFVLVALYVCFDNILAYHRPDLRQIVSGNVAYTVKREWEVFRKSSEFKREPIMVGPSSALKHGRGESAQLELALPDHSEQERGDNVVLLVGTSLTSEGIPDCSGISVSRQDLDN